MTFNRRGFVAAIAALSNITKLGRSTTKVRAPQPMREFLVFIQDKHIDPEDKNSELDLAAYKKGHVVVMCEEGHQWGKIERCYPEWRRFRAPMKQTLAHALSLPPIQTGTVHKIHRRDWHLDLTRLPGYEEIIDPSSVCKLFEFTEIEILKAVVQKVT